MAGALNTIYRKKNFRIYDAGREYIVHNTNMNFSEHHSHINNYKTCKFVIDLCIHKSVPDHLSDYLLVSLIRLTDDKKYKRKIEFKLEENRLKRKQKRGEK